MKKIVCIQQFLPKLVSTSVVRIAKTFFEFLNLLDSETLLEA